LNVDRIGFPAHRVGGVKRPHRIDKEAGPGKFAVLIGASIFTTALPQRSKTSLTSRLIVSVVGDSGVCCAISEATAASDVNVASKGNLAANLELESRLITHWHAVEHVAWRTTAVSLGAFCNISKRPRVEDPCGDGRCQRPFIVGIGRHGQY